MHKDLKKVFWWPRMKQEVADFVEKCPTCQKVKAERKKPLGLVKPLEILEWKWDSISMDFVSGLPRTPRGTNKIWVIVDRLTKVAIFIPMKETWTMDQLARAYIENVVRRHNILHDIISN